MNIYSHSKLSDYFYNCVNAVYDNVGDYVSYTFDKIEDTVYNATHTDKTYYHLCIYFQGSCQKSDWKANFHFFKTLRKRRPYKDMDTSYKVHSGFLNCWRQVKDIVKEEIMKEEVLSVTIIGYSHGAALATLCHEFVWFNREDLRNKLITMAFEAPRIYGGFKVKDNLKERWDNCYIFRNKRDLVTHLPPRIFGFCDVGNLVKIGQQKTYGFLTLIRSHYPENVYSSIKEYESFHDYIWESKNK